MFEQSIKHLRLLPVLVIVATIAFAIRLGDFMITHDPVSGSVQAQQVSNQPAPSNETLKETTEAATDSDTDITAEKAVKDDTIKIDPPSMDWSDSLDSDFEYSDVRAELFEALAKRRRALDEREAMLEKKEALLKATEQEITRKYKEMTQVRNEIKQLLDLQSEEEQKRIMSLVKVYEGMKAKDAAQIFNTLDMDILIEVMGRMSERKLSPILAEMDPDRARSVTIFLAEQKSLPSLPNVEGNM